MDNTTETTPIIPSVKMGTSNRYYFPEHQGHKLNGMMSWGAGKYTGEHLGKKTRDVAYGMTPKGDEAYITPAMFNAEVVLVKHWFGGEVEEYFYLTNKA